MGKTVPGTTPPTDQPSSAERLESWKEIAAYLKRDVRTVQRWEKNEGLPVQRHVHHSLGTVYAYKAELDAWWNNRRPRLEQEEEVLPSSRRRLWWALAATSVIVVAASLGVWRARRSPPLAFQERDWVLIANFENRTGEAIFDGTLEYALERDLGNSTFVNVVPRERINDALRLMKKPLNTRLDPATARELCLRDGGIRALLTGRVEKLGSAYALSVGVVDPGQGLTVASLSEDARDPEHLLPAVRRLSNRVREVLGEKLALIRTSNQKLEKATTPSLRAVELYSRGIALVNERRCPEAAEVLEQAVRVDSQFASAHIYLAHCYSNLEKDKEAAPHYQRAFELADSTSDRERYFILGSYYQRYVKDQEKAIAAYELLVRLYPDDYWGVNNLSAAYRAAGRYGQVSDLIARRAELRPHDFNSNVKAWYFFDNRRDSVQAQRYLERSRRLVTPELRSRFPEDTIDLEAAEASQALRAGDVDQALRETDRLAGTYNSRSAETRGALAAAVSDLYVTLGRLRSSKEWTNRFTDEGLRLVFLAALAEERGDRAAMREPLRQQIALKVALGPGTAGRLARAGMLAEARELIGRFEKMQRPSADIQYAKGELGLAQGNAKAATPLLRKALSDYRDFGDPVAFMAAEALSRALEQQGNLTEAIEALQSLEDQKRLEMRARFRLAKLYRKAGRGNEAQRIEADLLRRLAIADPDYPILVALKARQRAALSTSPR